MPGLGLGPGLGIGTSLGTSIGTSLGISLGTSLGFGTSLGISFGTSLGIGFGIIVGATPFPLRTLCGLRALCVPSNVEPAATVAHATPFIPSLRDNH